MENNTKFISSGFDLCLREINAEFLFYNRTANEKKSEFVDEVVILCLLS